MKDITKLIRRFVGILLLSTVLVIVLNIIILAAISASQTANGRPWTTAKETAEALQETETGYILSGDMTERLSGENAWAIYIDNDTLEVKWHTENLPDTVPLHYTISDIASLTRGYIDGYPTYTGECENGLVVVGYPKDRYWKHMSPSWDYDFIKNAPYTVLIVIGVNVFLIFLIYMIANSKLLKSVKPITNGIQALPSGEPVYVREKGLLSDLAAKINQTSDILQKQKRNLQRKETARAVLRTGESQRADGTYQFRWTDSNHKRFCVYAKTLDELRYKEEQIKKDKSDGIKTEARYTTVNEVYELWKELKRGLKNNTFENYKYMYETFVRHQIGSKTVSSLRKTDIKRFYNYLTDERQLKPSTIDSIHTVLHQILDMAVDDDYIRNNPSDNVTMSSF